MTKLLYTGIERKLISSISTAEKTIKVAVAWFTNPNLFNAIQAKRKEGVVVHLLLSDDHANFNNLNVDFQNMINNGVVLRITKSPRFMHNKFCLIDDRILISGSYNWTLKAERLNFENVIFSEDKKLVQQFQQYFDHLKFESQQVIEVNQISFSNYEEEGHFFGNDKESEKISNINLETNSSIAEKYSEELDQFIYEAELLYQNAKFEECVLYSKAKIIEYPEIPDFYMTLTQCYWRMKKNEEMIRSAEKVLSLNELIFDANNFIGIGLSEVKTNRKKALIYYNKCLEAYPDSHEYLVNRGRCYNDLANDFLRQKEKRTYYETLAMKDYKQIKEIINNISDKLNYSELYSMAIAEANLGEIPSALRHIARAISEINFETDIWKRDLNDYGEMKNLQYNLKTKQKVTYTMSRN